MIFLVQFGINKHLLIFQDPKLHSSYGLAQFWVVEIFTRAYLFQIAREKSWDYIT